MALNFVTFNQDNSLVGVGTLCYMTSRIARTDSMIKGTSRGFRQYNTEPFSKFYEDQDGDIAILEMLFSTSLVALILSPRLLRIVNTKVRVLQAAT